MDFYTMLSRYYDDLFPPNPLQIHFLKEQMPPLGKILDIGAGTGGYAAALAAEGAMVEALEIGPMLPYLMDTAEEKGFTALDMGMEEINDLEARSYNMILCIGNTLVHLESREQVTAFLQNCRRLLLPGGRLIIQIVNYDRILMNRQTELPVITVPDRHLNLRRHYVLGRESVRFITELSSGAEHWTSETTLLALKRQELEQSFAKAGFRDVAFYGDFQKAPWQVQSPATIAVATL